MYSNELTGIMRAESEYIVEEDAPNVPTSLQTLSHPLLTGPAAAADIELLTFPTMVNSFRTDLETFFNQLPPQFAAFDLSSAPMPLAPGPARQTLSPTMQPVVPVSSSFYLQNPHLLTKKITVISSANGSKTQSVVWSTVVIPGSNRM